ncbi:DUF4136 domain-containing protein [Sinomicrobium weinanense]|uniref:DUF4136 domain-containing protein n=1 Tax=Sinomicrobium weinanense TaxID=2842200 RepID=A0A926JQL7_9FLAO|nr:DUF4136 domain-containing protein [Sinomicrobium weinanense]MBC9795492.1 DUF4136 domain-containing protein [Sinomicrobium weinanense]MBU3123361.1 DUF4136 domain-containing protein [Sinomicrobium weinanense]
MRFLKIFFLSVLFVACSTARIDYDRGADFSAYKTFSFYPEMNSGLNQLDEKRIIAQTEALLRSRGFVRSDNPDMYINIFTRQYETPYNSSVGIGIGSGGRRGGFGISGGIPIRSNSTTQEITFDLIDAQKDDLFWQGVYEAKIGNNSSPEAREQMYRKVVQKVFGKYPPGRK